jgi:hypothetical protein
MVSMFLYGTLGWGIIIWAFIKAFKYLWQALGAAQGSLVGLGALLAPF